MSSINFEKLEKISRLIRFWVLQSTSKAGSGHPTSCLSSVELMVGLLFGQIFRFDIKNPDFPNNDRLIFSKGHAAPLLYALFAAAGVVSEKELMTLRQFGSPLEGHPTPRFPYAEVATGSLGQGLSVGVGMALNAKMDSLSYKTYVLLGDSEIAEGSCWEAIQLASYYKLDNLIAIVDVNRLGQRGETMLGSDLKAYEKRFAAFGWQPIVVDDGHDLKKVIAAYSQIGGNKKPLAVVAKTVKGKGVSFLEDKNGWHGKVLNDEQLEKALSELGKVNKSVRGRIRKPEKVRGLKHRGKNYYSKANISPYKKGDLVATRKAYGRALIKIFEQYPNLVVLDGEVSNSTYSQDFKKAYPERFLEMFIAEQNMVGAALGLSIRGKLPFVSSFSAFLTRAFDQIRMAQYSLDRANIKFVGSHSGGG
jgi:transketolase